MKDERERDKGMDALRVRLEEKIRKAIKEATDLPDDYEDIVNFIVEQASSKESEFLLEYEKQVGIMGLNRWLNNLLVSTGKYEHDFIDGVRKSRSTQN